MHNVDMNIIKAANVVNQHQQVVLIKKAKQRFGSLHNKKAAILGLSFKPNTDDIRDSPAVRVMNILLDEGVQMTAYDPVAIENVRKLFGDDIYYSSSIEGALVNAEMAFIFTEWEEIKKVPLSKYKELMSSPVLFDGRNCYSLEEVSQYQLNIIQSEDRRKITLQRLCYKHPPYHLHLPL